MFLYSHSLIAGILLTSAGCIGLLLNVFIVYKIMFERVFGRIFGFIWLSRGVAHIGESIIFCCVIGPLTFISIDNLDSIFVQRLVHSVYFFSFAVACFNLLIAVNRVIMIRKPLLYTSIFTRRKTVIYTGLCWFGGVLVAIPNIIDPCQQTPLNSDTNFFVRARQLQPLHPLLGRLTCADRDFHCNRL